MRTLTCPAAASTFELTTHGPAAAALTAAIPFKAERRVTAAGFLDCLVMTFSILKMRFRVIFECASVAVALVASCILRITATSYFGWNHTAS